MKRSATPSPPTVHLVPVSGLPLRTACGRTVREDLPADEAIENVTCHACVRAYEADSFAWVAGHHFPRLR